MRPVRTHLLSYTRAVCGINTTLLTSDMREVSCRRCNPNLAPHPEGPERICADCETSYPLSMFRKYGTGRYRKCDNCRTRDEYGNHGFKGLGKLCCRRCGEPYRDHSMRYECMVGVGV